MQLQERMRLQIIQNRWQQLAEKTGEDVLDVAAREAHIYGEAFAFTASSSPPSWPIAARRGIRQSGRPRVGR
jgi:hypothetical protein